MELISVQNTWHKHERLLTPLCIDCTSVLGPVLFQIVPLRYLEFKTLNYSTAHHDENWQTTPNLGSYPRHTHGRGQGTLTRVFFSSAPSTPFPPPEFLHTESMAMQLKYSAISFHSAQSRWKRTVIGSVI